MDGTFWFTIMGVSSILRTRVNAQAINPRHTIRRSSRNCAALVPSRKRSVHRHVLLACDYRYSTTLTCSRHDTDQTSDRNILIPGSQLGCRIWYVVIQLFFLFDIDAFHTSPYTDPH